MAAEQTTEPRESSHTRIIRTLDLGPPGYHWTAVSECGVVKLYSSRDGCMLAVNSTVARRLAIQLRDALTDAAESVERASGGGSR